MSPAMIWHSSSSSSSLILERIGQFLASVVGYTGTNTYLTRDSTTYVSFLSWLGPGKHYWLRSNFPRKCYPAEGVFPPLEYDPMLFTKQNPPSYVVFPTRFRAFAHGISAACGKAGAIVSALAFNTLSKKVGTPVVLWSAFLFPLPPMSSCC